MSPASLVIGNYNYSSWSLRAWLCARLAGFEFEVVRLPLDTPEFARRIGEYSPTGRVPVLRHDDLVVCDSLAIAEYLAELCPDVPLWPRARRPRARARSIAAEMHAGFDTLRAQMPMNCRAEGRKVEETGALVGDIARVQDIWRSALRRSGGPALFGEPGIADAMYAPVVFRFRTYGVALTAECRAYADFMLALPAMQEWLAHANREPERIEQEEVGNSKA